MPMALQMKLLRVLQEREFERLGDNRTIKVDVRIVAATNADLHKMVKDGTFREDLFYRLNVVTMHLPPLRDRPEDVPLLVKHFLETRGADSTVVSQEAMRRLMAYNWPGNVRQLENAIERAVAMLAGRTRIEAADLPPDLQSVTAVAPPSLDLPEDGLDLAALVARIERDLIERALVRTGNNKGAAARMLSLKRTTLVEKLKRFAAD
jgi:transcriptional regulator with PAS, ATPase and Fis domain